MARPITAQTLELLFKRTVEEGECFIWRGYHQNGTVPIVSHNGKLWSVRKLVAHLQGKKIPEGGFWTVRCGCRSCVAPDHIIWRSRRQHYQAMSKKLFSNPALMAIRNAKMGRTRRRLTDEQAHELMNSEESHVVMAKRMGVSISTIKRYRAGQVGATLGSNTWLSMLRLK